MRRKYEFTGETKEHPSLRGLVRLKKIRSLIDMPGHRVKAGDEGGWIETEENLSHAGTCWLDEDSFVADHAMLKDHAYLEKSSLTEQAEVGGHALIKRSTIHDEFAVNGNAAVTDSVLTGTGVINGESQVSDSLIDHLTVKDDGKVDMYNCTLYSVEPFTITSHVIMNDVNLHLDGGYIHSPCVMKKVDGDGEIYLSIDGKTLLTRLSLSDTHLIVHKGEGTVFEVDGQEEVVIKNGRFYLDKVTLKGNAFIDGGELNSEYISLSDVDLRDYSSIQRRRTACRYKVVRVHLEEMAILELKNTSSFHSVGDINLSNDEKHHE